MTKLEINGRTYSELPIPDDYQLVYDQTVERDGEKIQLRRYQPANLKKEALGRKHVTVLCRDDGYVMTYNSLIHPSSGSLPQEKELWTKAEQVWQNVDASYRQRLEPLTHHTRNATTLTILVKQLQYQLFGQNMPIRKIWVTIAGLDLELTVKFWNSNVIVIGIIQLVDKVRNVERR